MADVRIWIWKRPSAGKPRYTVRWYCPETGKMRGHACGTDRRRAEAWLSTKRRQLERGIYDEINEVSWSEFAKEHLLSLPGQRNRQSADKTLRRFFELCRPVGSHVVTYRMVEEFVRQRRRQGAAPATINLSLRELRAAFAAGVRRDRLSKNPLDGFKPEPEHEPIPVVIPDPDKRALLAACPTPAWHCFVYLLMTNGCRTGELLKLTWDRVDLDGLFLRLTRTKGRRDRLAPLVGDAVAMLLGMREGRARVIQAGNAVLKDPMVFQGHLSLGVNKGWARVREKAGLPGAWMKHLRSSAASDSAAVFDLAQVQDFMGHVDAKVTKRHYVLSDVERIRPLAERLAARLKVKGA